MNGASRARRGLLRVLVAAASFAVLVAALARLQEARPDVIETRDAIRVPLRGDGSPASAPAPRDATVAAARETAGSPARALRPGAPPRGDAEPAPGPVTAAPPQSSEGLALVGRRLREAAAAARRQAVPRRRPCDARGVGGRLVRTYETRRHLVRVCRARALYMLVTNRASARRVVLRAVRRGAVTRGSAGPWRYRAGPGGLEIRRRSRVVVREAPLPRAAGATARGRT